MMRAWAFVLVASCSGCTPSAWPAQRPTDFSIAYQRSQMTAPAVRDAWRLDATGWTFGVGMGADKAIAGPAEPKELDSAYQLVRDARVDRMESKAQDVARMDGQSETLSVTVSGKMKSLTTGTRYQLIAGDQASHQRALDGLGMLADGALARLKRGGPAR